MSAGYTLLEVVVALLLLEVAVLAGAGTLEVASRTLGEAEHLERAVVEAEGVLDSLAGVVSPIGGARSFAGGRLEWSVDASGVVLLQAYSVRDSILLDVASAVIR